jgi:DNA-binding cell septation regulator SpoVG
MTITIVSMHVVTDEQKRKSGLVASADVRLDNTLKIRRCALFRRREGYYTMPPQGRRAGDLPVTWVKGSEFDKDLTEALADAYEAMTDAG